MSRAMIAVARSQIAAMNDMLHLSPDELVHLGVQIAVQTAKAAGIDRRGLLAIVDDTLALQHAEGARD